MPSRLEPGPAGLQTEIDGLFAVVGADPAPAPSLPSEWCDARAWAESGAMALTGAPEGPGLGVSRAIATRMEASVRALAALGGTVAEIDGPALLAERAALAGFTRGGRTSPGGPTHLLRARDEWLAVSLARAADRSAVPAWLENDSCAATPSAIEAVLSSRGAEEWAERARLLGLPVAIAERSAAALDRAWYHTHGMTAAPRPEPRRVPRVVDFSSLWAGPLCTHLWAGVGAEVIKVESRRRPDAARGAAGGHFDLLNAGKASVAVDFDSTEDRANLRRLVDSADIVVEASRPRALRQLGLDAERWIRAQPGRLWLRITAHGVARPEPHRVGFGDDAAAAGGICWAVPASAAPVFVADALADPLAGVHAALLGWAHWKRGSGGLLDVCMADIVRSLAVAPGATETTFEASTPRARAAGARARQLGADNGRLFVDLAKG